VSFVSVFFSAASEYRAKADDIEPAQDLYETVR
jgi:hypothetical protein